jgi:hypothetical protein
MNAFDWIAEQRIAEAIARGDFDDLPGAGRPLVLDDDPLVPPEVRMAHRILRNAGFVPPELEERREAAALRALLGAAVAECERRRAAARLLLLEMRLEARGARHIPGTGRLSLNSSSPRITR